MPKTILEEYTPGQIAIIKESAYKIADAYQALKTLSDDMTANNQWRGQTNIKHIAYTINDQLTGDEGCLSQFLKIL